MKCPPEPVIDSTGLHTLVKLLLCSALKGLPLFERGMTIAGDRSQHLRAIGEEQCVADIEKDDAPFTHIFILLKIAVGSLVNTAAMTMQEKHC